jgi:hypothetical protein
VGSSESSFHTGGGAWEWLTTTHKLAAAATALTVQLQVLTGNGTVTFDLPLLLPGKWGATTPLGAFPTAPEIPERTVIRGYRADNQLLINWFFRDWSDGHTSAPDGWDLSGAGATGVADEDTVKVDTTSVLLTRGSADCYLSQDLSVAQIAALLGKKITVGAWAHCATASRARVAVVVESPTLPSVGLLSASSYHTGSGAWEWLTATTARGVPSDCTGISIRLCVDTGGSAYWGAALLVAGATATQSRTVTVTAPSTAGIVLSAVASKTRGSTTVALTWTGATASADVYRNEVRIATVARTSYADALGKGSGTVRYRLCNAGTNSCSTEVSVGY